MGAALAAGELAGPGAWRPAGERRSGFPNAAGTWRPARPGPGTGPGPGIGPELGTGPAEPGTGPEPGSYATTIPFLLARGTSTGPAEVAAVLAARLETGMGSARPRSRAAAISTYALTQDALAGLAVRIVRAGPGCARSQALRGTELTAPRDAQLAQARNWEEARQRLAAELAGRLAEAAGAQVSWTGPAPASGAPGGPVADAVRFAGEDTIRFALSPARPGSQATSATPVAQAAAQRTPVARASPPGLTWPACTRWPRSISAIPPMLFVTRTLMPRLPCVRPLTSA